MEQFGIVSLGRYLPEKILTNQDLERMVETTDEWITTRTGISQRRVAAVDEKTSDMAVKAALDALSRSSVKAEDIDAIIVATVTADSGFPSVACLVQKAIGAKKAFAFDVSAACSGFLYALITAKQFLASGMARNALVIASDKFTSIIDWKDRNTCVLFGDGAGAAVVAPVKEGGLLAEHLSADGTGAGLLSVVASSTGRSPADASITSATLPYVVMDGQEVFKKAVPGMAEALEIAARKAGVDVAAIKCVVPHQANDRIIASVAKRSGIDKEKFFINIQKYGNISAASVAVALFEAVEEGRIKKGDLVGLVVFGGGFVAAANIIKWSY